MNLLMRAASLRRRMLADAAGNEADIATAQGRS
jgi:hypothetical protein